MKALRARVVRNQVPVQIHAEGNAAREDSDGTLADSSAEAFQVKLCKALDIITKTITALTS